MFWAGKRHPLLREYFDALKHTPQIFRRIAFRRRTLEEELQEALLRGSLRKAFNGFDLLCLGLGIVIGTGWGLLSGTAAETYAGCGVILSYLFGGVSTLLAAACFAELCLEFPVSGGAFSYIMVTFGELPAFVALGGLVLEYALGMAAVARGFSRYLARLCGQEPSLFVVELGPGDQHTFDFMAAGIVLFMSVLLSVGVRESAFFISGVTVLKVVLIVAVSIVGFTRGTFADLYNPPSDPYIYSVNTAADPAAAAAIRGPWDPFLHPQYGGDGVFLGAALLFFTYVGWDAICNAAEEARDVRQLPLALMGTAGCSTLLYMLLALSLVGMTRPNVVAPDLPSNESTEDSELGLITVFVYIQKMPAMQYVVAVALLLGIVTALTVGLFSLSRIVMAASRDWLLPPVLARISKRTQTPLVAQMVLGVIIAAVAMLVEVQFATGMVSFGTLVALWLVCNAQMYRRYYPDLQLRFTRYGTVEIAPKQELASWALGRHLPLKARKALVWAHLVAINAAAILLGVYYAQTTDETVDYPGDTLGHSGMGAAVFALAWLLLTLSLQLLCPLAYRPEGWHVPRWLMPWLPSAAIALVWFSIGALPNSDYWKTGLFFVCLLAFYLAFSLPMSYIKHTRVDHAAAEECNIIELSFVGGQWRPRGLGLAPMFPASSTPQRLSAAYSSDAMRKWMTTPTDAVSSGGSGKTPLTGGSRWSRSPSSGTKAPGAPGSSTATPSLTPAGSSGAIHLAGAKPAHVLSSRPLGAGPLQGPVLPPTEEEQEEEAAVWHAPAPMPSSSHLYTNATTS